MLQNIRTSAENWLIFAINVFLYPLYMRLPYRTEAHDSVTVAQNDAAILQQLKLRAPGQQIKVVYASNSRSSHLMPRRDDLSVKFPLYAGRLDKILQVDKSNATATVEPNVTMERLVSHLLDFDLMPFVVAELKTLTVGGLIAGAGLESSSFRFSQFADNLEDCTYVTASGEIVTVSREVQPELFHEAIGAFRTLGSLIRCTLRLRRLHGKRFVRIQHIPTPDPISTFASMLGQIDALSYDFLDGIYFSPTHSLICCGTLADNPTAVFNLGARSSQYWYKHVEQQKDSGYDYLSLFDYLFRYDRCVFWMGRYAFPEWLSSPITRFLVSSLMASGPLYARLHAAPTHIVQQTLFVQDIYIPLKNSQNFLEAIPDKVRPIWLCPIGTSDTTQTYSPHIETAKNTGKFMINFGIYWACYYPDACVRADTRRLEKLAAALGGRKMLYADSYYTRSEFEEIYDFDTFNDLKAKHDPDNAWSDVYTKVVTDLWKAE